MKNAKMEFSQLDKEWVELILEAQKSKYQPRRNTQIPAFA